MEEWRYTSIHSSPRHFKEINGEPQDQLLAPGKRAIQEVVKKR
jgi:hypothetical protein